MALALPPEAISYEWAGDTQPIATNATAGGPRAQPSRRGRGLVRPAAESAARGGSRRRRGHQARQGLPHGDRLQAALPGRSRAACARAQPRRPAALRGRDDGRHGGVHAPGRARRSHNLRDKQNVHVRFIGYTDDVPLSGRDERIYGNHLALSKARAHRVALAVQEALGLPTAIVESDGRGATLPVAVQRHRPGSRAQPPCRGRVLVRRSAAGAARRAADLSRRTRARSSSRRSTTRRGVASRRCSSRTVARWFRRATRESCAAR